MNLFLSFSVVLLQVASSSEAFPFGIEFPKPLPSHTRSDSCRKGCRQKCSLAARDTSLSMSSPSSFSVKSSVLDSDLTPDEQTTVSVFRQGGPSVTFVTSTLKRRSRTPPQPPFFRRRNNNRRQNNKRDEDQEGSTMSLGSGSGFLVSPDGYMVTNFHVVQAAYQINAAYHSLHDRITWVRANATSVLGPSASWLWENPLVQNWLTVVHDNTLQSPATVTVQLNTSTKFRNVRIVDVRPEIDMAVLKVLPDDNATATSSVDETFPYVEYGSSSNLLVGQKVIAIGNPFGLDRTVTSGVVSALNRNFPGVAGNTIRNCIQTDAAINPGNSGGPLLNSKGQVVGVNTAIISTSGSNAGIGFAVPIDDVKKATEEIIRNDRMKTAANARAVPGSGYLGVELAPESLIESLKNLTATAVGVSTPGSAIVVSVQPKSPASEAGLIPFSISGGTINGDKIIAIGGKPMRNFMEVEEEMMRRIQGEKMDLTVEALQDGTKRVVYVTLARRSVT